MNEFKIQEITQGEDDDVLWITVGFESDLNKNDVLHIVCVKKTGEQDAELGQDTIYLERFDQLYSCYGGADLIEISYSKLVISFNNVGSKNIDLSSNIEFNAITPLTEANKILSNMSEFKCGKVVSIK